MANEPASQPRPPSKASVAQVLATNLGAAEPESLLAAGAPSGPIGGRWPVWCITLALRLVIEIKLPLRSTPKVLEVVLDFFLGRTETTAMMAWTTVRRWLMRLGLYALSRPLQRVTDWCYLIDHTVQIGVMKCFAVVAVRLSRLPYPKRHLCREDLILVALKPMEHSTAKTVKDALEEAATRTGVPRLVVSDEGGDVREGIALYCNEHPQTSATCDMAHKGANLLRKLLEASPLWRHFVAKLGQMKAKLQQTPLACCLGPSLRPKARFMNLAAPLRWARWCLRMLEGPWPQEKALTERQRSLLANIDRAQLEARLGWLRGYRDAIEEWSQWHEVIQVVVGHVRLHGIRRDSVATLQERFRTMKLSQSGQDAANTMLTFVGLHATAIRSDEETLVASTEVLESLFGDQKNMERQQANSGITGLILGLGALVSTWTQQDATEALDATPWKQVEAWIANQLGPTLQAQRRALGAVFAGATGVTKPG